MASNDDIVLKEQIKQLKLQQYNIKEEKMKLEKSIQESNMRCNALKMEANILAALDEVRFQDVEEPVSSASVNEEVMSRQFVERNLKLELEILNNELKHCLPKLEKDAIKYEEKSNEMNEKLQKYQKEINSLPIISDDELQKREEELMKKKELLHGKFQELSVRII